VKPSLRKWLLRILGLALLGVLLWWALRKAPLGEIWATIQGLQLWEIGVILAVNLILYNLVTLRWWIIVQAEAKRVPYFPLLGIRVAVFGISYFTLGPQVGGEPLQVISLQRRYGLSFTRAVASVLLDKLLEFLVDFVLLGLGLTAVLHAGNLSESGVRFTAIWAGLLALMLVPPVHLLLLYNRRYPLTALINSLPFIHKDGRPARFLRAAEWMAGTFCQRHLRALLGSLGVSLIAGAGMLVDYALMVSFLGIHLPFWKTISGWTAGWLAFLMPLPGGLGALEASQVFALGRFGISAGVALSVALLMRGRDLLIGSIGLILAGHGWRKQPATGYSPAREVHK
jgi:uncharacterized membrane protein YbhN (UPF0104 family)